MAHGPLVVNLWLFLLVIKQSGDVHPNPGPESLSIVSSDSSYQFVLHDYLNIVHVNIQSLLPKLDICLLVTCFRICHRHML